MAKLVLFGATGYVGGNILGEAIRRGHHVTAVARHTERLVKLNDKSIHAVAGSLYDRALVSALSADADVLICAITGGPDGDDYVLPDALPILVDAAHRNGARIAVVGGAGSLLLTEGGPQFLTRLQAIAPPEKLREVELHIDFLDALREVPETVDWFYLSPPITFGAHAPGERRGRYRIGADVLLTDSEGNSAISGEDYAIAFLDEIDKPRHHRRRFTVAY